MRPRPFQNKFFQVHLINEEPVRLDMAFPSTHIMPSERVVSIFRVKRFVINEGGENFLEQIHIFAPANGQSDVPLELVGPVNLFLQRMPRSLKRDSLE